MKSKQSKARSRTARNFIKTYGRSEFVRLLSDIAQGVSGQEIADRLHVSRERVRQWKNLFGVIHVEYKVYPEVAAVLKR